MIKARLLPFLFILVFAGSAAGQRPFLQDPALYTAAGPANKVSASAAKPVVYKLNTDHVVFGWFPHWLPVSSYGQHNYSLLSHVAYYGYQATSQGALLSPTGNPAGLVQAAHHGNAACKVLLSVSYQEPHTATSLFDTARTAKREALAAAIVAQVSETKADGVNLDFSFVRRVVATNRPAQAAVDRTQASLKKRGLVLVHERAQIREDSILLFNITQQRDIQHFADPAAPTAPAPPTESGKKAEKQAAEEAKTDKTRTAAARKKEDALKQELAKRAAKLKKDQAACLKKLVLYQADLVAFKKKIAPPSAVLQDFVEVLVEALRQKNPSYILTLTVPAVDSTAAYVRIGDLAPLVQYFVLKAHDYTASRPLAPGPLAPLQASAAWGASSLAASVQYYKRAEVPPSQLVVTFAHVGKVWADVPAKPLGRKAHLNPAVPYRYLLNREWAGWTVASQRRDAVSGSLYVQFGPNPDSAALGRPQRQQSAWVEDSTALATKYAWVLRQRLGGVGIWALGYEAPAATAWPLVRAHLVEAPPAPKPVPTPPPVPPVRWLPLSALQQIILFAAALLFGFVVAGFGIGVALNTRRIVPFRNRLTMAGLLLAMGLLLLAIYVVLLLQPGVLTLLTVGLSSISIFIIGLLLSHFHKPKLLP